MVFPFADPFCVQSWFGGISNRDAWQHMATAPKRMAISLEVERYNRMAFLQRGDILVAPRPGKKSRHQTKRGSTVPGQARKKWGIKRSSIVNYLGVPISKTTALWAKISISCDLSLFLLVLGQRLLQETHLMLVPPMMIIYIVMQCLFVCREKSSLLSWAPEARSEMFARPCRP